MQFLVSPRPQDQIIFKDFMILLDSPFNSTENEVLFVRIGAKVPDLWLDKLFEFKLP